MIKKSLLAVLALSSAMAMASPTLADCGSQKSGTVKFYNETKGFGFIKDDSTGNEYFFHQSGLLVVVSERDEVCFDLKDSKKGLNAVNIKLR